LPGTRVRRRVRGTRRVLRMDIVAAMPRVNVMQDFPGRCATFAPAGLAAKRARRSVIGN